MGTIVAEATASPVPVQEVKAFLRIQTSEEDALLVGFVRSAAEMCEAFTGRMLIDRSVEEVLPVSGAWTRLGAAPVRSITEVAAIADGEAIPLPADAFAFDIDANGEGWIRVTSPGEAKRIKISYRSGMSADWNGVPEALRQGIMRLAAHAYTHRESGAAEMPPAAVTALWRPWRRVRLG